MSLEAGHGKYHAVALLYQVHDRLDGSIMRADPMPQAEAAAASGAEGQAHIRKVHLCKVNRLVKVRQIFPGPLCQEPGVAPMGSAVYDKNFYSSDTPIALKFYFIISPFH